MRLAALLLTALLSIKVSPQMVISFTPVTVTIRARIQPQHEMRSIGASIVGGDFGRSSAISLDGENAAPLQVFEWRSIPPGEYTVTVELYDSANRVLARDSKPVRIVGQEEQ